jgi:MOSC domain-containing protein YiiM
MTRWTIEAVCTGTARPFHGAELSAFAKRPREGIVQIHAEGLAPDEQADRRVHGGPEMALHLYPLDHHDWWRGQIGDHFACGSALIEVSRPRAPCWKIEHRFERKGMVAKIIETGRCGWYFRVIETGEVQAGDTLERIALGEGGWSIARVFRALVAGKGTAQDYAEIAALPALSPYLREKAAAKRG